MQPATSVLRPPSCAALPDALFEACPTQTLHLADLVVRIAATADLDALLDFYVRTPNPDEESIPYFAVLWDSARALAYWLATGEPLLRDKLVVELGCGLGLPSMVAALRGARVLATDAHPDCGRFLHRNAETNRVPVPFKRLEWSRIPPDWPVFDLVLASDVLYHRPSLPQLVTACIRLCGPGGRILLADPGRDGLQPAVTQFMAAGFTHEMIPVGEVFVLVLHRETATADPEHGAHHG